MGCLGTGRRAVCSESGVDGDTRPRGPSRPLPRLAASAATQRRAAALVPALGVEVAAAGALWLSLPWSSALVVAQGLRGWRGRQRLGPGLGPRFGLRQLR